MDNRTTRLAELLVHDCTDVQPGQWVLVRADVEGLPLANQVVERTFINSDGKFTI